MLCPVAACPVLRVRHGGWGGGAAQAQALGRPRRVPCVRQRVWQAAQAQGVTAGPRMDG